MKAKWLRVENPETKEIWFRITPFGGAEQECKDAKRIWPHLNFSLVTKEQKELELERQTKYEQHKSENGRGHSAN